jgi:hypothetical protein
MKPSGIALLSVGGGARASVSAVSFAEAEGYLTGSTVARVTVRIAKLD